MSIGLGGGIMWVPVLLVLYKMSPPEAVATSLAIQVVGLGSGTLAYIRAREVNFKLAGLLTLVSLPGVIIGSLAAVSLPKSLVQGSLGLMSLSIAMIFVFHKESLEKPGKYKFNFAETRKILHLPAFFGVFSGFLSVGIGEWIIPTLKTKLKMNMYKAVANVIAVMFVLSIAGTISHSILADNIRWNTVMWGSIGVIVGAQIGPRIAEKINDRALKESFIYIMTLIGIHEIFSAL